MARTNTASTPANTTVPNIETGTLIRRKNGKGEVSEYRYSHAGKKGNEVIHYLRSLLTGEVVKEPLTHTQLAASEIVPNTGKTAYLARFTEAVKAHTLSTWQIGDLANEKDFYKLSLAEIADQTGISEQSLTVYASVAKSYPAAERVDGLSFGHHQAVQGNKLRKDLLSRALAEKLSVSTLKSVALPSKTSTRGAKTRSMSQNTGTQNSSQGTQTAGNQTGNQTPALTPASSVPTNGQTAPLPGGTNNVWNAGARILLSAETSAKLHEVAGGGVAEAQAVAEKVIQAWLAQQKQDDRVARKHAQEMAQASAKAAAQGTAGRMNRLELDDSPRAAA